MNRRSFLAGAAASLLPAPAIAASQPNVLFVVMDDMNDFAIGGYPGVRTPNLDRLRAIGRTYTQASCTSPTCSPARAAMFYGVAPWTSGHYTNQSGWYTFPPITSRRSLVRMFKDNGYTTCGTGKLLHGTDKDAQALAADAASWSHFEYVQTVDPPAPNQVASIPFGAWGGGLNHSDGQRCQWMASWLRGRAGPWFAGVGISKPHLPLVVPQKFFDMYPLSSLSLPAGVVDAGTTDFTNSDYVDLGGNARRVQQDTTGADHQTIVDSGKRLRILQAYLAAISYADACLGLLLDEIDLSQTLVVVTADHGWQHGEKLCWHKQTLWERAVKVPLVISGPGVVPGTDDTSVSTMDLAPTLMQHVFGTGIGYADGTSFHQTLSGGPRPNHRAVTALHLYKEPWAPIAAGPHFRVRSRDYSLIEYRDGQQELYAHPSDRWELNNLLRGSNAAAYASVVASLRTSIPATPAPTRRR